MKNNIKSFCTVSLIMFLFVFTGYSQKDTTSVKQNKQKLTFVDKDGDGYNDNAPDHDGDGIPNGLDKDYAKLKRKNKRQGRYIDLNGDGINDYAEEKNYSPEKNKEPFNGNQNGNSINKSGNSIGKGKKKGK